MKTRGPFHRAARAVARRALRNAVKKFSARTDLAPSAWRLERDPLGQLTLDGALLANVAGQLGTPVHVVDAVRLRENAARFTHCPAARGSGCEIFYSYKTNPVPGVLRMLHAAGVGAETSSPYELWLARTLGVPAEKIVYNCPVKTEETLREALQRGVGLISVNSRHELSAIAAAARATGVRPRVGIRVAVPQGIAGQFGERIEDGSALQTFAEALERTELDVVALHAHPSSGEISTRQELRAWLGSILRFCAQLRTRLRLDLEILDLGGSLVCPTVTRYSPVQARVVMAMGADAPPPRPGTLLGIDDYIAETTGLVEAHYKRAGRAVPRIFLEPGRSMTSNAQLLLLRVNQVRNPDDTGIATAVLDGGINVAEPLRTERHQVFAAAVRPGAEPRQYRLSGPTCTLADVIVPSVWLPRLEPGDLLAVMDSGAYFIPYSTTFSFPRPPVALLDRGELKVLRRAETFEDLVALDRLELDEAKKRPHTPRRDRPQLGTGYDPDTGVEAG